MKIVSKQTVYLRDVTLLQIGNIVLVSDCHHNPSIKMDTQLRYSKYRHDTLIY